MKDNLSGGFLHRVRGDDGKIYVMWNGEMIEDDSPVLSQKLKEFKKAQVQKARAEKLKVAKEKTPDATFLPDGQTYANVMQRISDAHGELFNPENRRHRKDRPFKTV